MYAETAFNAIHKVLKPRFFGAAFLLPDTGLRGGLTRGARHPHIAETPESEGSMSAKSDPLAKNWKPRAWTPGRCAVWNKLAGEQQTAYFNWVDKEPAHCYPEHISPEWLAAAGMAPSVA